MMATCCHAYSLTTAVMVAMLALSEGMVRRNVGKRRLSERMIDVAVGLICMSQAGELVRERDSEREKLQRQREK